eukprot:s573_g21.t1
MKELKDALQSLSDDERLQKKFILALARVSLENLLPAEVVWSDIERFAEKVVWSDIERFAEKVGPEDLCAAVADPAGLVASLQGFMQDLDPESIDVQVGVGQVDIAEELRLIEEKGIIIEQL